MNRIHQHVLVVAVSVIAVVAWLGGCSKTPDQQMRDLYVETLDHINAFDYVEAESTIAKMGAVMTSSPWIPLARGIAFEQRLEYWDALHQYHVAREAAPDFAPAYDRSARLFARLGLWQDAIDDAFAATKNAPSDSENWIHAAQCLLGGKLFDRVHQTLAEAEKNGASRTVISFIAAQALFDAGKWDSAAALAASLSISPNADIQALTVAADYFESAGMWDSAMTLSRKALQASKRDFDASLDHFNRSLRTKYFADARQLIDRYVSIQADSILVTGLKMLVYEGSSHRLGGAQFSGSYREVAPYVDISPIYWDMRMRQYNRDEYSGEQDLRAIEQLMTTQKWLPDFQTYMRDLIVLEVPYYLPSKTVDERLKSVKAPWTQRRKHRIAEARNRDRWGQFKEFDSTMIALKQYYGTEPEWIADIAELYAVQTIFTRSDSADAWFMKALNSQPWRPETFASCIAMYDKLKLYGVAIEMFDTFPQYEAHQPHFRVMRAIDEVRAGKIDDGVRRYLNGFPLISGATVFADTIIQELREKDAADKLGAIYDVLSAPALHDNVDALMLLADGAFLGGDPQTSLDYCNRAEAIESANGFLLARKARALYGVGKTDESFKLFESILAEHPRTTNAYLYYSQLLANDPSQFDKAANWARAACVETDASLNEVLNLCDVYYKVGRYDLMLGEARKMLNLHPSEPDVPYWVGLGLYLNQRDSAQMFFDKSIALGLKGEKLQRAKETLAKVRNR